MYICFYDRKQSRRDRGRPAAGLGRGNQGKPRVSHHLYNKVVNITPYIVYTTYVYIYIYI